MDFDSRLGDWRSGHRSLVQGMAAAVRDAVLDGRLPVGGALPSERALARSLDVSRGTVVAGLAVLRDEGWIHTRRGSGSVIRLPPRLTERTTPWSLDHGDRDGRLDLTLAVTAAPHQRYLTALRRAVDRCATLLLDSGIPTAGLPELREAVAGRYTSEGLPTRPEQILITSGAQAALTLLLDHLHDRRRPVIVENPTYPGALAELRRRRARLVGVPVNASGWDGELFGRAVASSGANLAYLMPDFQNPTGIQMPAELRTEVTSLAARHELTVITDETMRDLDLRTPPRPLPHLSGPHVISVGSTSKVVWSGLRVGWIRASARQIGELMLNPLQPRLSPPPFEQAVACDLLGDIDDQLHLRRARLRAQRDHLAALLAGTPEWSYLVPPGGLSIWLRLHGLTGAELTTAAARRGLLLSPGRHFTADGTLTHYVRLPFTATPDILSRAADLLGASLGGK